MTSVSSSRPRRFRSVSSAAIGQPGARARPRGQRLDHVLGRGTTVVEHPEGRLADYLESLERVRRLHARALLPGHGPVVDDPDAVLDYYVRHRAERLDQIVAAVAAGATTPREIVERVYVDTDRRLHPVAELSVRAGLELLVEQGRCAPLPG